MCGAEELLEAVWVQYYVRMLGKHTIVNACSARKSHTILRVVGSSESLMLLGKTHVVISKLRFEFDLNSISMIDRTLVPCTVKLNSLTHPTLRIRWKL